MRNSSRQRIRLLIGWPLGLVATVAAPHGVESSKPPAPNQSAYLLVRILKVNPDAESIEVKGSRGSFRVTFVRSGIRDFHIREGKRVGLSAFKAGDQVVLYYGRSRTARSSFAVADLPSYLTFWRNRARRGELTRVELGGRWFVLRGLSELFDEEIDTHYGFDNRTRIWFAGRFLGTGASIQQVPRASPVYVAMRRMPGSDQVAYAAFDDATWRSYADQELQRFSAAERRRLAAGIVGNR